MQRVLRHFSGPRWPFYPILLLSFLLIAPLWEAPGLPNSADGPLHLHRSAAVARAFAAGLFWPRWFPDVYQGLGAPTFHYYSPLFYFLTAALHSLGLALDSAAKAVISGLFVLSGLAAYAWLRRLLGAAGGLIGAAIFLSQPHIFREFYFQGDYPQLIAILLLPVCLWAFTCLGQMNRRRDWLCAPLALAALVLAHNLTAMIGAGLLAVYWLLLLAHTGEWRGFVRGAVAAVVAALLSAFFWMPALGDVGLVQVQNLQRGFFDFRHYFLSWAELLSPIPAFDRRAANPPFPHAPGWASLAAIGLGSITAFRLFFQRLARPETATASRPGFWALAGGTIALASLLLTLPVSLPVWDGTPGLNLLQFPSRLLAITAIGAALCAGAALAALPPQGQDWAVPAALLLIVGLTAVFLFPRHPFLRFPAISPDQTRQAEIDNSLWGMTSGNEFLPRWARPPTSAGPSAPPSPPVELHWQTPHAARFVSPTGADSAFPLPIHYFPAWAVLGANGPIRTGPTADGLLAVRGATASQSLRLIWAGTAWQRRGQTLALVGLLFWLLLLWRGKKGSAPGRAVAGAPPAAAKPGVQTGRRALAALLCLLALRQGIVWTGSDWFQPRSPANAVSRAVHPLAVTIGGGEDEDAGQIQLLGWDPLYRGEIQPGDRLGVRLYWQPVAPLPAALHSFLHLYSADRKRSWAIVQNQNPGRIPTTAWLPALYYVDDLVLDIAADQPPGNFGLAVGLVTEAGERLAVAGGEDGLLELGRVEISPQRAGPRQPLQPEARVAAQVGDDLLVLGYDLLPAPGGPILRTYWEAKATPAQELSFFVHLLSPTGERLAQWDGPPLDGLVATRRWLAGRLYIDRRPLPLPQGLAPGLYTIHVGLYDPTGGVRLPFAARETPPSAVAPLVAPDGLCIPFVVPE